MQRGFQAGIQRGHPDTEADPAAGKSRNIIQHTGTRTRAGAFAGETGASRETRSLVRELKSTEIRHEPRQERVQRFIWYAPVQFRPGLFLLPLFAPGLLVLKHTSCMAAGRSGSLSGP